MFLPIVAYASWFWSTANSLQKLPVCLFISPLHPADDHPLSGIID